MGLPRQEYWNEFPSPGDLHYQGMEPTSLAWQADSLPQSQQRALDYCNNWLTVFSISTVFQSVAFPFFFFLNCSIIALQCYVSFCCTRKWISYMYTHIPFLQSCPTLCNPMAATHQASLSITISHSLLRFMSIMLVMHPIISISVVPFSSCFQSFPATRSFPMSWHFA